MFYVSRFIIFHIFFSLYYENQWNETEIHSRPQLFAIFVTTLSRVVNYIIVDSLVGDMTFACEQEHEPIGYSL